MDGFTSGPNHFLERSSRGDEDLLFAEPLILSCASVDSSCCARFLKARSSCWQSSMLMGCCGPSQEQPSQLVFDSPPILELFLLRSLGMEIAIRGRGEEDLFINANARCDAFYDHRLLCSRYPLSSHLRGRGRGGTTALTERGIWGILSISLGQCETFSSALKDTVSLLPHKMNWITMLDT